MNELLAALLRASRHNFVGRLARDPETRFFDSGNSVTSGRILINQPGAKRDDGKQPDGFNLKVWGDQGQAFADQCRKGDLVEVVGRVMADTWEDRNSGETRKAWVVTVDRWALVGSPGGNGSNATAAAPTAAPARQPSPVPDTSWASTAADDVDDDDVPF